jgi:FkbM family methyltransferase
MLIDYRTCKDIISLTHHFNVQSVLHIGAHIGEEATTYSENGVLDVTWFEANQELLPHLKANISRFQMKHQIIGCALWHTNEHLKFNITNNMQSSSVFELGSHKDHYPQIQVQESREIQAFRFDSISASGLVKGDSFHFLNIDTQGAELAILKGFGDLLFGDSIKGIYLEVNKELLYTDIPLVDEIDSYLLKFGFHRIISKWTDAGWGDAFYLKEYSSQQ